MRAETKPFLLTLISVVVGFGVYQCWLLYAENMF